MRWIFIYCFSFAMLGLYAQEANVSIAPFKIEVGMEAKLKLRIVLPEKSSFTYKPFDVIIPARKRDKSDVLVGEPSDNIEQIAKFSDTVYLQAGKKIWEGTYIITAWDEGIYDVEAGTFFMDDSTIVLPTAQLKVSLTKQKEGKDLYDISEHFAELPPADNFIIAWMKTYYWVLIILAIVGLIYWRWKMVSKTQPVVEKVMSLKARTMLAIDLLEKEKMWEKGKLKEHYIELSFILRSYLSSRYDLNLLEKTTPETKFLLGKAGLHPETIASIEMVLAQSDLVKFAKSQPQEIEILKVSQKVRMIVTETSPLEFENAE